MAGKKKAILCLTGPFLLMALLALGVGGHPNVGVNAASCSVSGTISSHTTWNPATCDPYIVTASVIVPSGVTLTIAAGTTVKFDSLKGLLVQGTLVARGTAQNPITFTSNQATPAKGDWTYIYFADSSTDATYDGNGNYAGGSIVQYAVIEYGGGAAHRGEVTIEGSSPYIDHNTIRNSGAHGIYAWGGDPHITNNSVNNTGIGIFVQGTGTISNNNVSNNTANGIMFSLGTALIANNIVSGNAGLGISVESAGTATVSHNTITNNRGGASASGTVTVNDNVISGNSAIGGYGGGIYASWGKVTIVGNAITGNSAIGGGGVSFVSCSTSAVITGNTIVSNTATQANRGGGLYLSSCLPTISNNDLYGNTSGSPATANDLYNGNQVGSADVDAKNNYWGTTDPSVIEDHIWHFPDDASLGLVDYIPYRSTPVGPAPTPTPTPTPTPFIPNLTVTKIAGKERVYVSDTLSYLIFLENSGQTGISVTLTDTLPAGPSYITGTLFGGGTYSPTINSLLWSGTVPSGLSSLPSQVFTFRVRVDDTVPGGAITNTLTVSDGATTVTSTARTEVWRRTFVPFAISGAAAW